MPTPSIIDTVKELQERHASSVPTDLDLLLDLTKHFPSIASHLLSLHEKVRVAEEAISNAPECIRAGMQAHKGEAYRVATQVLGEALDALRQPSPSES